jgi:septal ring factor EnvC (AmiA/AmiB activator)
MLFCSEVLHATTYEPSSPQLVFSQNKLRKTSYEIHKAEHQLDPIRKKWKQTGMLLQQQEEKLSKLQIDVKCNRAAFERLSRDVVSKEHSVAKLQEKHNRFAKIVKKQKERLNKEMTDSIVKEFTDEDDTWMLDVHVE